MMGSPVDEPGRHKNEEQHQVILTRSFYMQTTTDPDAMEGGDWEQSVLFSKIRG